MTNENKDHANLKGEYDELVDELITTKRFHEKSRKNTERYKILVENSLTGIYIDQGGRILYSNDRFAEIYGYPKEDLIGMESRHLVHPEDRELTDRMRMKRLKGEEDTKSVYDARGVTQDGRTIWIRRRNTQITYRGKPAILGNVVDITEQKQTREALKTANEELNDLIHVVTHDLNTPIIAIHGFTERLLKNYEDRLDEKGQSYLNQILECSDRVKLLVEDLRELSKTGGVSLEFEEVSSQEIVESVKSLFQELIKSKQLDISIINELPVIQCDKKAIYRVFENLISNAVKYMGKKQEAGIEIGYDDQGDFHRFFLKDNGIGIDPAEQGKIFRKFYRTKESKEESGTGLGLAIVKGIIENHGGRIWVESKKGEGSTFLFTLPKQPSKQRG